MNNTKTLNMAGADSDSQWDMMSAITGLIAALLTLATLFGVYVAALQLSSQRRITRQGLSEASLGPWLPKVLSTSPFKIQQTVATPYVSSARLVHEGWCPRYTFPTGIVESLTVVENARSSSRRQGRRQLLDMERQATTSWVNFMQSIGIDPKDEDLYDLRPEPGFYNGKVPMLWKGYDLVIVAATLGFRVQDESHECWRAMPEPTIWISRLGFLHLRSGFEGCVAEFQKRPAGASAASLIAKSFHDYFGAEKRCRDITFAQRVCYTLDMVMFKDENTGAERIVLVGSSQDLGLPAPETISDQTTPTSQDNLQASVKPSKVSDEGETQTFLSAIGGQALNFLSASDNQNESIPSGGSPVTDNRGSQAGSGLLANDRTNAPGTTLERKKAQILQAREGYISNLLCQTVAAQAGIDLSNLTSYVRAEVDEAFFDKSAFPCTIAGISMDGIALQCMKQLVLQVQPCGFYFVASLRLKGCLRAIYDHVGQVIAPGASLETEQLFSNRNFILSDWTKNRDLWETAQLLKNLYHLSRHGVATLSVSDMTTIMKASVRLERIIDYNSGSMELFWALIASPDLFFRISTDFHLKKEPRPARASTDDIVIEIRNGILFYPDALAPGPDNSTTNSSNANGTAGQEPKISYAQYPVPLSRDGKYTGLQLTAAYMSVCLTVTWIINGFTTNITDYASCIPPSVLMF